MEDTALRLPFVGLRQPGLARAHPTGAKLTGTELENADLAHGEFALGAGWYTPSLSVASTNFGFVVVPGPNNTYWGQLNVVTANKWWYQANVTSYGKTSKAQGLLAGTGSLYSWSSTLNKGHGGWQLVASGVTYKATANAGTNSTASFAIVINYTASGLPNSSTPMTLTRGGISIV